MTQLEGTLRAAPEDALRVLLADLLSRLRKRRDQERDATGLDGQSHRGGETFTPSRREGLDYWAWMLSM